MSNAPVVVLGAGPAGASTALWCADLGLPVVVLEGAERLGGQLHAIHPPLENLPGLPGARAEDVAQSLVRQLAAARIEVRYGHRAWLDPSALRVHCAEQGLSLDASAVVVATGVRHRALGVPNEQGFLGKGVEYNVGPDPARWRGMRILVIGGGDDAFEHARLTAPHARQITLVHRSDRYSARAAQQAAVRGLPGVTLRPFTVVEAFEGNDRAERARLRGPKGVEALDFDVAFVCIGPAPNTEGLPLALDAQGYVVVDRLQRTSREGVWAVGDVCCREAPTLSTALGHGAVAAKAICAGLACGIPIAQPPRATGPDLLRIEGLTFPARIGVYPSERRRTQTLTFTIEFEVNAAAAAPTDALGRTIDYAEVAATIGAILAERHFNLIETVAQTVVDALLTRFPTRRARVRVQKPGVPQAGSSASLEVERAR
ncbi:dihydroneopterin aldolase [Polyangium aurulentum]|uniref:dihydroneopterin aldolase n=1 Tax=Polyangium aurulentum TaxID=2567896 RepID=UPI00146EAFA7|nr:dihydroneopterin aldolase [Polyangium aurulentum]UQA60840.1 dihydroneopterin aldolase [Polyangium aurulentum]